uniref:ADAMTS like 3 n=1 Tax=Loxodonta africana TaxID=9785 RepID=G3SN47_LOXAF
EKDGHCLQNSKRLGITKSGSLKIHSLAASDIGVYRCIAGTAHETGVLKLIGTDNRLIIPPALREHRRGILDRPHQDNSWGAHDAIYSFMRALWATAAFCRKYQPWELKNKQEAAVKQGAYSMDTAQFEELIRNMSQLMETGEVSDDLASQVIYQLVAELAKAQSTDMQWRGIQEGLPPAAQLRGETGSVPKNSNAKYSGKLIFKPEVPVLVRQSQPSAISFNKTINSRMGNTVYITKKTKVINILCDLVSPSETTYTWTKDGALLQPSVKIILDGMGKIQIRNPTRKEQGIYGCSVANHLGSDMESSSVLYAEAPVILSIERNITKPEHSHLSAVVGGVIEAALRANVTIQCPVKGVPEPNVTWLKRGGSLSDNISLLFNGSLLLQNISLENEGTYVCTATNALGKAMATSVLHLLEQRWPDSKIVFPKGYKKHVLLASNTGPNISDTPGEASPQVPFWEPGNWTHCSATCGHLGTSIQRLRCVMTNGQEVSEALCDPLQKPLAGFQPCNIRDCPARWLTSAWSECSVSCGEGFRSRQVTCKRTKANGTVQVVSPRACATKDRPLGRKPCSSHLCVQWVVEPGTQCPGRCMRHAVRMQQRRHPIGQQHHDSAAPDSHCDDRRRPPTFRRNCSSGACDVCWRTGPWRPCTTACGRGFQARKVDCVHRTSCKPVAERHCGQQKKPTSWRHCLGPSCDRDCTDTTHYCMFVKHLNLCSIDLYKQRCCQSCQEG